MPEIKIATVVSCSSEDKRFPAENLLKPEGTAKWKSATPGEKSVSAILQLEKASLIHQIDIGNEGSAFVEVLVGKAAQREDEYQVILVASSFMNPQESRSGSNPTRVRIFPADKLSQAATDQKWDRLKIVCTQPFCKTSTYGLSFIKVHSPPGKDDGKQADTPKTQTKIGAFTLKTDDSDDIKTGSLFAKKKTDSSPLTGAAAVRQAARQAEQASPSGEGSSTSKPNTPARPKQREEEKTKTTLSSSKKRPKDDDNGEVRPKMKRSSTEISSSSASSDRPPIKRAKTEPSRGAEGKDFSTLMKKVVFVLSGYQNPERGKLRDKALEMGATYKSDWGRTCTHLICAFPNTPKYQQVSSKGRIVSSDWITDCYRKKMLLPWRKYRVGKAKSPPNSSGSESEGEPLPPSPPKHKTPDKKKSPAKSTPDPFEVETDSGEDTDDEINRVKAQASAQIALAKGVVFDDSTDDESTPSGGKPQNGKKTNHSEDTDDDGELPPLPDFFKNKHFFLYGKFLPADRHTMVRYITAYNGVLEDYMSETVRYVITDSAWDDTFDEALSDHPDLVFVKPDWLRSCHEKQKCLPHQKYVIVPA